MAGTYVLGTRAMAGLEAPYAGSSVCLVVAVVAAPKVAAAPCEFTCMARKTSWAAVGRARLAFSVVSRAKQWALH